MRNIDGSEFPASELPGDALADVLHRAPAPSTKPDNALYAHVEKCKACRGRGRFISWAGRDCGPCFKCKGKGERGYVQSGETRARNRANAQARKERTATGNWDAFVVAHADQAAWIGAKRATFEFAQAMFDAVQKYGCLTEKQDAAIAKCIARDAERTAQSAARVEQAPAISVALIEAALNKARNAGLAFPKLRAAGMVFSFAGANSKNAGAIYVKTKDDRYLGKIAGERFIASRECTAEETARVMTVAADPAAAAIAYGRETGECSCCGRELTNQVSIERGIGPICYGRYFS